MSAPFGSDPWLDARLRNVPLPVGMLQRLNQLTTPADEELDAALRDVPLPADLCQRLEQIAELPQRQIAWLPPLGTRDDWHPADWRAVRWARQNVGWRELAIAASLLLAIGAGYLAISARLESQLGPAPIETLASRPNRAAATADHEAEAEDMAVDSAAAPDAADDELLGAHGDSLFPPIEFKPLPLPGPRVRRPRNLLFASDPAIDHLPPLEVAGVPADRGLAPPLVAGYDLISQLKTGERSFVAPSADPQLAWTPIPLGHDTSSYRQALRLIAAGRLPAPEDVRIEDYLNAQCDHYPAAESPLVIRVAAGPAPFGEPGLRLLQVGVQAGRTVGSARPAADLTIAVDTSASMWHGQRLEMVRQALRRLTAELTPADRVTLIGFSDDAQLLADHLQVDGHASTDGRAAAGSLNLTDRTAFDRWLAAVERLVPDSGTNVGAGIALAGEVIGHEAAQPGRRRQLVLLSDGLAELGPDAKDQIAAIVRSLAGDGVGLCFLDVSGQRDTAGPLGELAAAGQGQALCTADTDEISAALADALAGSPQTLARSASLKVTFNPQAVGSYRLVGHATTTLTGPASASTQIDLRAGARRAGLIELWLLPGGGDDVATAELTWHDPSGSGTHKLTQRISRVQFARSFAESALSLQAAVVASETARALRVHAGAAPRSLTRVVELAQQASPRLNQNDSFRQLVELAAQADKLRGGSAPRRSATAARP